MKKIVLCGSGTQNKKDIIIEVCMVNLIATYEDMFLVPDNQCITEYFGDYGSHFLKRDVPANTLEATYKKALEAIGLSKEAFESKPSRYMYRANVKEDMCARINKEQEAIIYG